MGELANYTIDQVAGALALTLGSVGGLCLILFKSRFVQDDEDKTKPADNANEVALVNQPEPVILPPPQPNAQVPQIQP